jgi:hypothetical protein
MSEFIVKGPEVYMELKSAFNEINQRVPAEIVKVSLVISNLSSKINSDLLETTTELKKKSIEIDQLKKQIDASENQENSPDLNEKQSQNNGNDNAKQLSENYQEWQRDYENLKNKEGGLKSAQASLEHLLFQAKQCESKITQKIAESKKGIDALTQFESIANNYLNISINSSGSSTSEKGRSTSINSKLKTELVGVTLHINNENTSITQVDIDHTIKSLKDFENQKAQKISFSEVSQSSFSILEKNGFTIQKIEPNKYSAYKEI